MHPFGRSTATQQAPVLARIEDGEVAGGAIVDYLTDAKRTMAPGTIRQFQRFLLLYLDHVRTSRRDVPLSALTRESLASWWALLIKDKAVSTSRNHITAVRSCWAWTYDSDVYGEHCPRPRRFVMPSPSLGPVHAPTWGEMDRAIQGCDTARDAELADVTHAHLADRIERSWVWRKRSLIVMRCTGLRISQVMRLRWEDLNLGTGLLHIRGELGKSKREKLGRTNPLAPVLLEEMAGWGVREGWVIGPHLTRRHEVPSEPTTRAWIASGVRGEAWQGRPHHAFRRGFKTGLSDLGARGSIVDFLVGHVPTGMDGHYLDRTVEAREAVALVPEISAGVSRVCPVVFKKNR